MPSDRRPDKKDGGDPAGPPGADHVFPLDEAAGDREAMMREALRIAGVGAWELDIASQTLSWSNEIYRMFGIEPGSQQPSSELFYSLVHEEDRARMLDRQQDSYDTGVIFDEEYRIVRPDGEVRYMNSRAQIVPRGPDGANRFLGVVRDITERRMFEQRLSEERAVADRLQASLIHLSRVSAMDAMASTMAHELNQPLTSVLNYAAGIRQIAAGKGDAAMLADVAEALQDNAARAAAIIKRLRDMTIRGEVRKERVPLARCVDEAVALSLGGASIEIGASVPEDLFGKADRVQLQQVIVNLVRNAIEATAKVARPRIDIEGVAKDESVCLRIGDNGPGIAAPDLPRIFEPFVSTKAQGMGVGLAISRTIVEAHGGRLTVETAPGEGATFVVTLPTSEAG